MKKIKEWFIGAPWGKIALVSWGMPKGTPVLLVHGRQDSLATFIPLLGKLPEDFHYVALDLPGHGKSDPFPKGAVLCRSHFIAPVDIVVKSLGWKHFVYIGHSMGAEIGLFYNVIRPERVLKFVFLDAGIAFQKMAPVSYSTLYSQYENYYQNYESMNHSVKVHTKASALEAIWNARRLSPEMAELVLSRNLIPYVEEKVITARSDELIGLEYNEEVKTEVEEKYTLAWDQRLKNLAQTNLSFDHWVYICTSNLPPTLFVAASESVAKYKNSFAEKLIQEIRMLSNVQYVEIPGNHDVHLNAPDRLAEEITAVLMMEIWKAKL